MRLVLELDKETADRLIRIEHMIGEVLKGNHKIMTAIDDLKTNVAGLIGEATADITALINNAANNSNDPAIKQLASDVATATANLHASFLAATGTPVPPPSDAGTAGSDPQGLPQTQPPGQS